MIQIKMNLPIQRSADRISAVFARKKSIPGKSLLSFLNAPLSHSDGRNAASRP